MLSIMSTAPSGEVAFRRRMCDQIISAPMHDLDLATDLLPPEQCIAAGKEHKVETGKSHGTVTAVHAG